jgi:hypothetical protein
MYVAASQPVVAVGGALFLSLPDHNRQPQNSVRIALIKSGVFIIIKQVLKKPYRF